MLERQREMSLLYKPDWEEAKERYRAWWAGEAIGRCALSVVVRKANPSFRRAQYSPAVAQNRPFQRPIGF